MIYCSGVRVVSHYKSLVKMTEEGILIISLPQNISTAYLTDVDDESTELMTVALSVVDNSIVLGSSVFKFNKGFHNYEIIR